MSDTSNGNGGGLSFTWGKKTVTARGLAGIYALVALTGVGTVGYSNHRVEQAILHADAENHRLFDLTLHRINEARSEHRAEHERLRRSANLNACVSLFDFSERRSLRGKSMRDLLRDCPFLDEEPR